MHYIGVDYHKKTSYVTVLNDAGERVKRANLANSKAALEAFLEGVERPAKAVVEACYNWTVMYDWLEEKVEEVQLAHPAKVKLIAEAKIKNDRISALTLAQLLRADLIPPAYVPGPVTRGQRRRLRQRMFLVGVGTMLKNRIHALLDRHPELTPPGEWSDLFGVAGRQWLAGVPKQLSGDEVEILRTDLALLGSLEEQLAQSEAWVIQQAQQDARARLLDSLPGFGPFLALLVALEIDEVRRFLRAEKLCAYAGLVPASYASGSHVYHGRITKCGNKWLRWACLEAVHPAVRKDAELRAMYERLKAAKGSNAAAVAVAKRLLTMAYHLLTEQREYAPAEQYRKGKAPAALSRP